MTSAAQANPTATRDVTFTRVFDAPRSLVFKMWTDPKHLAPWWGPRGCTVSLDEADRPRALHADQGPLWPDIQNLGWIALRLDPLEVAILVAGIDHHQVACVRHRIDEDVIDDAALLVAEQGVLDSTGLEPIQVTRDDTLSHAVVNDSQLTHVGEIEETNGLAHCTVFFADAAVLQRHHPAAEVRHLGVQGHVLLVKRGSLRGGRGADRRIPGARRGAAGRRRARAG